MLGKKRCRLRFEPWQRTLYTIVVAQIVAMLGFTISVPFLPFYIQELGVTDFDQVAFWVGFINSAAPIMMALSAPVWGLLADRHGRKPMLVRAMVAGGLCIGLQAVVATVPQLAVLRVAQGALTGTVAAATTLVATSVPRDRCGVSLGLLQTAIFAASSLGPSLGGIVGGTLGYRAAFVSSGVLLVAAGLLVMLLVREEFTPPADRERSGSTLVANARAIVAEPVLLAMIALLMLNNLANSVTTPVLPLYVQSLVGSMQAASTATGLILGATALANAAGAIWIARLAGALGQRTVLLTCMAIASLVCFPQMLTRNATQLLVLRSILGLALGGVSPVANALIAERSPQGRQGGIYGISTSLNALGQAIGPMLGTVVVTHWSLGGVFPMTGALLGIVVAWVALTTHSLAGGRRPALNLARIRRRLALRLARSRRRSRTS